MQLNFLYTIFAAVNESPFWSSLVSSLLIVLLASVFLPAYITWVKRPKKLEFFFKETSNSSFPLTQVNENEFKYSFELVVRHYKGNPFNQGIYWHFYIPEALNPKVTSLGDGIKPREDREEIVHYYGKIGTSVFAGSTQELHYRFFGTFKLDNESLTKHSKIPLLYWFSTEFGNYPKSVKKDIRTGLVDDESVDRLYLVIPGKLKE